MLPISTIVSVSVTTGAALLTLIAVLCGRYYRARMLRKQNQNIAIQPVPVQPIHPNAAYPRQLDNQTNFTTQYTAQPVANQGYNPNYNTQYSSAPPQYTQQPPPYPVDSKPPM